MVHKSGPGAWPVSRNRTEDRNTAWLAESLLGTILALLLSLSVHDDDFSWIKSELCFNIQVSNQSSICHAQNNKNIRSHELFSVLWIALTWWKQGILCLINALSNTIETIVMWEAQRAMTFTWEPNSTQMWSIKQPIKGSTPNRTDSQYAQNLRVYNSCVLP